MSKIIATGRQVNEQLSMRDAMSEVDSTIGKLESYCRDKKLDGDQAARKRAIFCYRLLHEYPLVDVAWADKHIGDHYTPGVSTVFPNHAEISEKMPDSAKPLVFKYNENAAKAYLKAETGEGDTEKKQAIGEIQRDILKKAHKLFEHFAPGQRWSPDLIKHFVSVITDGGRVLALEDQGGQDGGFISVGKQACNSIATVNAIPPQFRLALGIDIGTTQEKLDEPGYQGLPVLRKDILSDNRDAFTHLVLEALDGLQTRLIQFEDFDGGKAFNLLDWAKTHLHTPYFNDDIEGAGAVVGAAMEGVHNEKGVDMENSLYFFVGAGGMNGGLAKQLAKKYPGIEKNWFFTDVNGSLFEGRNEFFDPEKKKKLDPKNPDEILPHQKKGGLVLDADKVAKLKLYASKKIPPTTPNKLTLTDLVDCFKGRLGKGGAIFLVGASSSQGHITEELIEKAHKIAVDKTSDAQATVVIMPMTNPSIKSEIIPDLTMSETLKKMSREKRDNYFKDWVDRVMTKTNKKAVIISGTRIPVKDGADYVTDQANNILLFPALTLACYLGNFSTITKDMWNAGIGALLKYQQLYDNGKSVIPSTENLIAITEFVAEKILAQVIRENIPMNAFQYVSKDEIKNGTFHEYFLKLLKFTRGEYKPTNGQEQNELMNICGGFTESRMPTPGEIEALISDLI